jgi:hypothetical protein
MTDTEGRFTQVLAAAGRPAVYCPIIDQMGPFRCFCSVPVSLADNLVRQ